MYRRKSDLSGKEIISIHHPDSSYIVYSQDEWWDDKWDPLDYGRDFDFIKPFFEQFKELQLSVPRPGVINNGAENSKYCNFADQNKNCYLLTSANRNEDSLYGFIMLECKDAVDVLWTTNSEILYECTDCDNCYNVRFGENCDNCTECSFIAHSKGLKNCILCVNLNNASYHILNKQCSKEEYEATMKEISGSYEKYEEMKKILDTLKQLMELAEEYFTLDKLSFEESDERQTISGFKCRKMLFNLEGRLNPPVKEIPGDLKVMMDGYSWVTTDFPEYAEYKKTMQNIMESFFTPKIQSLIEDVLKIVGVEESFLQKYLESWTYLYVQMAFNITLEVWSPDLDVPSMSFNLRYNSILENLSFEKIPDTVFEKPSGFERKDVNLLELLRDSD